MMAYLVTAHYYAQAGEIEAVAALLRELAEASRQEPGNIYYYVTQDIVQREHFVIVEQYLSEADFAAHGASTHFQQIGVNNVIPRLDRRIVERALIVG